MMIRIVLPFHLRNLAQVGSEVTLEVEARLRCVPCSTRSKPAIPCCAEPSATTTRNSAGHSCASSPAKKTSPTSRRMHRSPTAVASGKEPLVILGAIAGG